ncbi:solute carrier family 35, member F5 [Entomortierella parvispora]|uniref:Solute carrier family 35, member F5 n=1 Tax=Entomortierella parvispora TaxID=205924 RepID=A0A9P3LSS5_9FUNG|nr:solute carrier family 35, member F5 [Entomortierella parvispora]
MYNKPFFVTYVNTASFSLYLLGPLFRHWLKRSDRAWPWSSQHSEASSKSVSDSSSGEPNARTTSYGSVSQTGSLDSNQTLPTTSHSLVGTTAPYVTDDNEDATLEQGSIQSEDEPPLSHREIAELSFAFCILWFAANWATNASLAYTTVASSTILASMSGFFTLAIGAILKTESFSTLKFLAVCASVMGVALVSESDRGESGPPSAFSHPGMHMDPPKAPIAPLFGDFLALMSAMFYGCYTVLLKVRIQNESRVNMSLFFGFVGLFNLVLLWPMFGVLHWTGVEPFELPSDTKVIWMIGVNAIVGTFVSDYLWLLSMLMTSPLVVTLGLSLTIPLALLGDVVGYGRILGLGYWIGAGLVLAGFFGVNGVALSERDEAERQEEVAIRSAASCTTAAVAASALVSEERLYNENGHSLGRGRTRSRSTSERAPLLSSSTQ